VRYVDRVPVPPLIPIAYEPGYRTDKIGRYDDGLFLASAWDHHVYVHLFAPDGTYRRSTIARVDDRSALDNALEELLASLHGKVYGDIAVQLFQIRRDGVVFGLIDESGDRAGDGSHLDWVELYPDRLGFHEPWDGLYDT
jgi:formate hydrogenlyase regulatory protein HycA